MRLQKHIYPLLVLGLFSCTQIREDSPVKGVGIYPGRPEESGAPVLRKAGPQVRNLALNRAAVHSSSYDFNLTAQLATDGIQSPGEAPFLELCVNGEKQPRDRQECLIDGALSTRAALKKDGAELILAFHGMPFSADRIELVGEGGAPNAGSEKVILQGSMSGGGWFNLGEITGFNCQGRKFRAAADFPCRKDMDRVRLLFNGAAWCRTSVQEIFFFRDGNKLDLLPSRFFHSSWKSAGSRSEWIQVDLGADAVIENSVLHWQNPPVSGRYFVSRDGRKWKSAGSLSKGIKKCRGRYVKAVLDSTANDMPFELKEWEISGRGGITAVPADAPQREGCVQYLTRGAWRICRASEVECSGEVVSDAAFDDSSWLPATVPGTVLASYVKAGAVPDPNIGENQIYASESWFRSAFWYRNTFDAEPDSPRQFLHFDGINFKASVFLNGAFVGKIDGAFLEGNFDVTGILRSGANTLAVKVEENPHFGAVKQHNAYSAIYNGGPLGEDNPTMHATAGWDWLPSVRGRSVGIIDDVYLNYTGQVTLEDPFVRTELPLPETDRASIIPEVTVVNHSDDFVRGRLGFNYGSLSCAREICLQAGEMQKLQLDRLTFENPRLWWPNGYGEPTLYPVSFKFECGGSISDRVEFLSGVRQTDVRYDTTDAGEERLNLYVNGKRFVPFGGNWGLSEHMLGYRGREYDIAVGNHARMNFTMIRNWVGQIYDREFYEACDRYGILLWQDFWLANPADGPVPSDNGRFIETAASYVKRIRNHPCIGIYVGRNEGFPPETLDRALAAVVKEEHPGIYYLSNSADGPVSGRGPYRALPVEEYYSIFGQDKIHTERGMPCIMSYENLARALGKENLEPVSTLEHPNGMYGLHDYNLGTVPGASAAQRAETFNVLMEKAFGEPSGAMEFTKLSPWLVYDGYRAIFESRSKYRQGMLLWMSHPAWPSLVWQTYDYFFEPTAAYFACKKACEPIHIQMNPITGDIEVVSWYSRAESGMTAKAAVYDFSGEKLREESAPVSIGADETLPCMNIGTPESCFVKLSLEDAEGRTVSDNFYWRGDSLGSLKALMDIPYALIAASVKDMSETASDELKMEITLQNKGTAPAMMIRLKVLDSGTGDLALPVWYSDNYFFLMGGGKKTVSVSVRREDLLGKPVVGVEGLNVKNITL